MNGNTFYRNIAIEILNGMGITKTDTHSAQRLRLARMYKALGHPARLAIVQLLIQQDSCMCGDLVSELPLAQSTVSQHLHALKEAGLIKGTVSGAATCYCIDAQAVSDLEKHIESMQNHLLNRKTKC
jgi:predicted transcriptional regulator